MYLVITRMPGESYRTRLGSLLLYLCYVVWALINTLMCWFCTSALGLLFPRLGALTVVFFFFFFFFFFFIKPQKIESKSNQSNDVVIISTFIIMKWQTVLMQWYLQSYFFDASMTLTLRTKQTLQWCSDHYNNIVNHYNDV